MSVKTIDVLTQWRHYIHPFKAPKKHEHCSGWARFAGISLFLATLILTGGLTTALFGFWAKRKARKLTEDNRKFQLKMFAQVPGKVAIGTDRAIAGALIKAIQKGNLRKVQKLTKKAEKKSLLNFKKLRRVFFLTAVRYDKVEITEFFLKEFEKKPFWKGDLRTRGLGLQKTYSVAMAKLLVDAEANPNGVDQEKTAAHHFRNREVATYLMEQGADPMRNDLPTVPALSCMKPDVLQLYLDRGLPLQGLADDEGNTLLHTCRDKKMLTMLFDEGFPIEGTNGVGDTPFLKATRERHFEIAQLLLDAGANATATNHAGENALFFVKDLKFIKKLLNRGVQVNQVRTEAPDVTPLEAILISRRGGGNDKTVYEIVQCFIQAGADLTRQNGEGNTALHLLMQNPPREPKALFALVNLMVHNGAAPATANGAGETPLTLFDALPGNDQPPFAPIRDLLQPST